jgi:hypothetical protein
LDRVRQKKRGAVRIPVSFGQAEVEKEEELSEYRSHSDRRRLKKRRSCQNTALIRTG